MSVSDTAHGATSYQRVCDELLDCPQWICWQEVDGKKLPKQIDGQFAESNNPDTWTDSTVAIEASYQFTGPGFVFSAGDPYCGVDLDNCLDDKGNLRDWVIPIVIKLEGVSYGEISPSGNGIKFFTRARKPEGKGSTFKVMKDGKPIGGKQQVECYDQGRYFAVTGKVYGDSETIGDGQQAIDWLYEHVSQWKRKDENRASDTAAATDNDATSLWDRGIKYTDNVPAASKGTLRNAAFSLSGHLYALVDGFGGRLSDAQRLALLHRWNQTNPPADALRSEELEEACANGPKNGTPPADKPPKSIGGSDSKITVKPEGGEINTNAVLTLEQISELAANEQDAESMTATEPLPAEIIERAPGLVGEIQKYILSQSVADIPEMCLAAGLSVVSIATGRGYVMPFEEKRTRSNIYCVCLAPSGTGKEFVRKSGRNIVQQAQQISVNGVQTDFEINSFIGPSAFSSDAAIAKAFDGQPQTILFLDELSSWLATVNSPKAAGHIRGMLAVLVDLYNASDETSFPFKAYASSDNSFSLDRPHPVIFGTSTPVNLFESIQRDQAENGVLGRLLFFQDNPTGLKQRSKDVRTDDDGCVVPLEASQNRIPSHIVDGVKWLLDHNTPDDEVVLRLKKDAYSRLSKHRSDITERAFKEHGIRAAIWMRAAEKSSKFSMIAALARRSFVVEMSDVDWAIKLTNALTRRLIQQASGSICENATEADYTKLLKIIRGGALKKSEFNRRCRWLKPRDREAYLHDIVENGDAKLVQIETGGRPALWLGTTFKAIANAISIAPAIAPQ